MQNPLKFRAVVVTAIVAMIAGLLACSEPPTRPYSGIFQEMSDSLYPGTDIRVSREITAQRIPKPDRVVQEGYQEPCQLLVKSRLTVLAPKKVKGATEASTSPYPRTLWQDIEAARDAQEYYLDVDGRDASWWDVVTLNDCAEESGTIVLTHSQLREIWNGSEQQSELARMAVQAEYLQVRNDKRQAEQQAARKDSIKRGLSDTGFSARVTGSN